MTHVLVGVAQLHRCYRESFVALGVPEADATTVADTLSFADRRGIDTHGAARLPVYAARIEGGGTRPVTDLEVLDDHGAVVTMDANDGLGQVAAASAMRTAIERAGQFGLAVTTVRGSNHLGVLSYYAELALPHDMIGFALSGVASTLAAHGGSAAVLGSNPWSIAIPASDPGPLVVDMAQGVTITPHLRAAAAAGEAIPEGWAVDEHGEPTTDPSAALRGSILPFGGHKGYALTLALEVLASVLPGAAFSTDIPSYEAGTTTAKRLGHLLLALRTDLLPDAATFADRVGALLQRVKASGPPGGVRVPGERGRRTQVTRVRDGVPVPASLVETIRGLSRRLSVFDPFA